MRKIEYALAAFAVLMSPAYAAFGSPDYPAQRAAVEITDPVSVELAKRAVLDELKDPDSAKFLAFSVFQRADGEKFVCGRVNAKNDYGGYSGPTTFWVRMLPGHPVVVIAGGSSKNDDIEFAWYYPRCVPWFTPRE